MSDSPNMTPPPAAPTPPPMPAAPMMSGRPAPASDTSKLLAALGYPIWIVALIAILIDPYKDEKFVKFHGFQALGFAVAVVVAWIAFAIVSAILLFVPVIGALISTLLWWVLWVGIVVVAILWAVKAYNGEYAELPIIYGIVKGMIGE
jgi:uncharacterized membrane protein